MIASHAALVRPFKQTFTALQLQRGGAHSRDLVNREVVSHPLDRESQLDLQGVLNGGGFDPSLFHAPDGTKWLLNMRWDSRIDRNHFPGILIQQYSPEEQRLIGEPVLIFRGTELGFTEGPHIYYIDGWYYLMTAEGGTSQGHAITMARPRSMHGPFEVDPENPLLTARDAPDSLLQYARGRRSFAGGHLPRETATVLGEAEQQERFFGEYSFDSNSLDSRLMSLRIPADERVCSLSARPGWLRMYGRRSILCQHRQSMLGLRMLHGRFAARKTLDFQPELFQQMADLSLFYNTANFYYLYLSVDERLGRCVHLMQRDSKRIALLCAPKPAGAGPVELRFDVDHESLRAFFRMHGEDGWTELLPSDGEDLSTHLLSDEYANLCGEQGFTFIYVTHDQTEAMTMGSRIVVMKDGFMQQQDTPKNLYDYPANLFVGCFIGTPQMNVFDVKLEKRGDGMFAAFGDNAIKVPAGKIQRMTGDYIGKTVYMGVRPENIHDEPAFTAAFPDACIRAHVELTELMDSETYPYLSTSGREGNFVAHVDPRTNSCSGNDVTVGFDVNRLHFFDPETERTILSRD